ncbi:MAG TPA: hypothetical protein VGL31_00895 [Xanthobacteraceae bacterium]
MLARRPGGPCRHAQPNGAAALAAYMGADRERLLIDGARQEGELTLYSSMQRTDAVIE